MFDSATRRRIIPLPGQNRVGGGGNTNTWTLPKVGLLARIWISITGTVANSGVPIVPATTLGAAAFIRRVRLTVNSGVDLLNVSGPGYFFMLAPMLESELADWALLTPAAKTAPVEGALNLSMMLPIALNFRDPVGLVMLQSESTVVSLSVEWDTDAAIAANLAPAGNLFAVTPYMEVFSVPADTKDWPELSVIHTILEESQPVAAAGQLTYNWPRGGNYLQVVHGCGLVDTTPADLWTRYQLRVNQSDYLYDVPPAYFDMEAAMSRAAIREPGTIPIDFLGSSGLGNYGKARDLFNSGVVTDLASVVAVSAPTTFYTMRRQLVALG